MTVPVIELGFDRSVPDELSPVWLRRRLRTRRLITLLALAMLPVIAGPGALAPARPPFVELFESAQVETFWLTGQSLHIVAAGGSELTTYRLDGSPQWTVPVRRPEQQYSELQIDLSGRLVLATVRAASANPVAEVTAYDSATGELRWRRPGTVAFAPSGADRVVLHRDNEFEVVYPRSGMTAWSFRLAPGELIDVPAAPVSVGGSVDHLVLLDATGHLTVRELDTGAVLATRQLSDPTTPRYAQSVGPLVLVSEPQPEGIVLRAYERRTLALQWTVVGLPPETSVGSCPPVLCVIVSDGLLALDPETGVQLWAGGWIQAFSLDNPWPNGYLLGERFVGVGSTDLMGFVLTARTGRVVVDMRGWLPAAGVLGAPQPVVRRRIDGGRVWFGVVRPERERVEPLGVLDDAWGPCAAAGDLLACRTADHRVRVWRVRR